MSNTYCSKRPSVRSKHRAVAPIIATLLMVAIAVVGGILVYTFTQGFFSETAVNTPTIDILEIYGYDARNSKTLQSHAGTAYSMHSNSQQDAATLGIDQYVVLYVRNMGGTIVTINDVKMFGVSYTLDTTGKCNNGEPDRRQFVLNGANSQGLVGCALTTIEPGKTVSVFMRYDGANGDIQVGRPIPIQLVTGTGMKFSIQMQNGVRLG